MASLQNSLSEDKHIRDERIGRVPTRFKDFNPTVVSTLSYRGYLIAGNAVCYVVRCIALAERDISRRLRLEYRATDAVRVSADGRHNHIKMADRAICALVQHGWDGNVRKMGDIWDRFHFSRYEAQIRCRSRASHGRQDQSDQDNVLGQLKFQGTVGLCSWHSEQKARKQSF
jgi:hypothetical protein